MAEISAQSSFSLCFNPYLCTTIFSHSYGLTTLVAALTVVSVTHMVLLLVSGDAPFHDVRKKMVATLDCVHTDSAVRQEP